MQSEGLDYEALAAAAAEIISSWGLRVVGAIAFLSVGWLAAKAIRGTVRRAASRKLDPTLVPFVSNLVYYLLLTFVILAVLSLFGIQTTSFIAVLGAVGLAIGLSLQGTLSNFASGVMLLIFRPFKAGDFVEAGGVSGKVQEIGIFSSTLHSPDNVKIIVPNSVVFGSTIKNYSANETRRNDMVVGVSYDDDLGRALDVIQQVLAEDNRVLKDPAPVVAVSELADSSVNFVVRPWCNRDDYWGMRFDMTRKFKERLESAGCSIPYPQHEVHLHRVGNGD